MNPKLIELVLKFRDDRDWEQFHTGENLAKALIIEAAELLEMFQWSDEEKSIEGIEEELADVLIYCILLAETYNLDIEEIIRKKVEINSQKYPVDKAKGSSKKYDQL